MILYEIRNYYPHFSKTRETLIRKAFWFAHDAHKGVKRFSGAPYFSHPIAATKILLSIKPDIETVCACLLHDVIEDTPITAEEIAETFGENIRFLCEGVEKIAKIRLQGKEREFESLKKLFVAMAKDIRVIFIKLADRIHNLQTLEFVRPEKRIRISRESLKIYAPVADKLGLFEFKTQIEDLCFSHIHEEIFKDINRQIKQSKKERKIFIERANKEIKKALAKEKVKFQKINGRTKNIYSVYEKMKRKSFSSVDEIYDLFAIRIIVDTPTDCYRALGVVHAMWKPIPKRFKDYIAVPKTNGYQSLHTTILGLAKSKIPTEIQIRTEKMHLDAELGPAAHWAYKKTKSSNFDENYVKKTDWLPQSILVQEPGSAEKFFEEITTSLSTDRIHVFTPRGDIKDLVAKSTPVDFAFAIHSEIGSSCIGAKVNGTIKPLNYELKTGDVVEIMTKKGKNPNPLWLKFTKSSQARGHIKNYINKLRQDSDTEPTLFEKLPPQTKAPKKAIPKQFLKKRGNFPDIIIGGETNLPYKICNCCKPVPGKDIIAYKSRGLEFSIHEATCKTLSKLDSERFVEANFNIIYSFKIRALDRIGLLKDYANVMSEHGLNIIDSKFTYDKQENISCWYFSVEISSPRESEDMTSDLKKVPNVIDIETIKNLDKNKKKT